MKHQILSRPMGSGFETFAFKVYCETKSQTQTVDALLNEYVELAEDEAEIIAISAVEHYKSKREYEGQLQFESERGN